MRSVQSTLLLTKLSSIRSHRRSIILQKSFRLVACMILCAMHSQRGRAANSVGFIALSCLTTPNAICYQLTENAKVLTPVNNICGYAQKACIAFAMVTNNQNYEQATTLEETDSTAVVVPKEKKKSKKTVIKYDADDYDYPDWLNTTDPMNLASKETNLDSFQMTFCTFEHRKLIFGMTMQRFWYLTSSRFQLKFKSQQNSQMLSQTHRTRGSGFLGNYTFAGRTASCSNIKMAAVPEIFEANQGSKATRLNFYYIRYFLYMTGPDRSPVFSYRLLELPGLYRKNDYLRARRMCTGDNDCVAMRTNDYRNNCFLKNMCTSFLSWKTQVPPEEEFEKLSILLMSVPIENGIWVAVTLSREPSIKEGDFSWLFEVDNSKKIKITPVLLSKDGQMAELPVRSTNEVDILFSVDKDRDWWFNATFEVRKQTHFYDLVQNRYYVTLTAGRGSSYVITADRGGKVDRPNFFSMMSTVPVHFGSFQIEFLEKYWSAISNTLSVMLILVVLTLIGIVIYYWFLLRRTKKEVVMVTSIGIHSKKVQGPAQKVSPTSHISKISTNVGSSVSRLVSNVTSAIKGRHKTGSIPSTLSNFKAPKSRLTGVPSSQVHQTATKANLSSLPSKTKV